MALKDCRFSKLMFSTCPNHLSIVYAYIYYCLQNVVIHATVWNVVPQNWNSEHSFNTVRIEYIGEITTNSKSYFLNFWMHLIDLTHFSNSQLWIMKKNCYLEYCHLLYNSKWSKILYLCIFCIILIFWKSKNIMIIRSHGYFMVIVDGFF